MFFTGTMFFCFFTEVQCFFCFFYRGTMFFTGTMFFRFFLQRYNVFLRVQCFFGTLFCSVTISFLQVQSFLYRYNLFIGIIFFRHNFFQANCFKGTIFLRVPFFCIVTSFTGIFFLLPCHLMITPVHHVDCDYHFDHHHIHDQ